MNKTVYLNDKIVSGCKENNSKAQMKLYDMYCDAMFNVANRFMKNKPEAEDMMQEAFIKVFKNIQKFKGEVSIGAWIKRIVINQCIDHLKRNKVELVSIEDKDIQIADEGSWIVEDKVKASVVTQMINSLPEKYKVILNLYLIEGYDHQEIAQVLNITEVNSRSQLMRGKTKLKSQLKQYNYA